MAIRPKGILSLFSGTGAMDLAVRMVVPGVVTKLYCEREIFCAASLVERMQEGSLDDAPIWSDVTTLRGEPWRGLLSGVVGSPPCQPASCAGKRSGKDDDRWLWGETIRLVREIEPEFFFFENVAGLTSGSLQLEYETILNQLQDLGYAVTSHCFTASEVGATHKRERVFILGRSTASLANAGGERGNDGQSSAVGENSFGPGGREGKRGLQTGNLGGIIRGDGTEPLGDASGRTGSFAHSYSRGSQLLNAGGRPDESPSDSVALEHAAGQRLPGQDAPIGQGSRSRLGAEDSGPGKGNARRALPVFPPGPNDHDAWRRILEVSPELAPALSEEALWKIAGRQIAKESGPVPQRDVRAKRIYKKAIKRRFRKLVDGMGLRVDQLRAAGNGVCPLQAAYALTILDIALGGHLTGGTQ